MNRMLVTGVAALVLGSAGRAQQPPGTPSSETTSAVVRIEHLVGDPVTGFRQSCLVVYEDGRYHREIRNQDQANGRPSEDWLPREAFEGRVSADELQKLKEIVDSERFTTIAGTIGDPTVVRHNLAFSLRGGALPHDYLEIFEAWVGHASGVQAFEVLRGYASIKLENSLKGFMSWVGEVEKERAGKLDKIAVNNCTTSSSARKGSPPKPMTHLSAKPIYNPDPGYSLEEQNATHYGRVRVQALVNADGSVGSVSLKHGIDPVLDRRALDAVRTWKFSPARLHGMAVPSVFDVEVKFRLY